MGTEHLLLALIVEGEGIASHVRSDLGITLAGTRTDLESIRLAAAATDQSTPQPGWAAAIRRWVRKG